jgi:hypothetical protein
MQTTIYTVFQMSTNRAVCFVIMPFSKTTEEHTEEYWTRHFESFLKPLIEQNRNFEARRSQPLRGDLVRQIITDLVVSPVVVADLTDNNANVFWELGVRQSFKHGTVTIAQTGTRLPFDLAAKGTLFYPDDRLRMAEFNRSFREAMQDCLDHPDRPDSHVLETISGRGTLFELLHRDEAIRRLKALLSEMDRNMAVLGKLVETAKKNQKDPAKRVFLTVRLTLAATELLITHRYVEEGDSFFEIIEDYYRGMLSVNEQLPLWENSPDTTERWLLEYLEKEEPRKQLRNIKEMVASALNKISGVL